MHGFTTSGGHPTFNIGEEVEVTSIVALKLNAASDKHIFAIATQTDGNELVSAPVWIEEFARLVRRAGSLQP